MADYYAILTNTGKALEAAAIANGTTITLIKFVVGDGNGQAQVPDPTRTALVHEVYRNSISDLTVSIDQPNQIIAQLVIPANVGGFTVREIGLLTDNGELYAIANCATFDKPVNGVSITMQFRLAVSDTENVTLDVATGDGLFLRIDKNLADVKNKESSRLNLDVYSREETENRYLKKQNNLSDLQNKTTAKENLYIDKVGNFMSVQQGGATGMLANKVYIGWSSNKGLICHVDSTPLGSIYCEQHKPTASDVGAYPIAGGNLQGGINALGSVGTQGGSFLIRNADGVQVASVSANSNGSITVYSDVSGRSFGISNDGNFYSSSGAQIIESGQRVYSPNNPQPIVQLNQDNIGSLAFARLNPQDSAVGYGGLVAGSSLSPAGVTGYPAGGNWAAIYAQGSSLPGTWKCLGQCISDSEGSNRHFGSSLFVRIS